jgi:membrane fusion protein, multidrug efflux system
MRSSRAALALLAGAGLAIYLGIAPSWVPFLARSAVPRPTPLPVPVGAAMAQRKDVPIYLTGLGSVQAYNSVLVKSRVDGQIIKVNFAEGMDVHAGDALVEIDPRLYVAALSQAKANKLKDEAQLANARLDSERFRHLTAINAVSTQQLDTARALVGQLEASVAADQAQIDMAQTQLDYTRIRSPIDGRAGTRLIDVGNIVHATDTAGIVVINQMNPIFVTFALPADTLPQIRSKLKVSDVKVTAQDSDLVDLTTGTLAVVDNQINAATGTITFKAVFSNADRVLWPGQFVNVRVEVDIRRNALVLPVTAVQQGPDGPFVFVVGQNRIVHRRSIKVGTLSKTTAIVDEGVQPGELVVTDGQYRIRDGTLVDVLAVPPRSPS